MRRAHAQPARAARKKTFAQQQGARGLGPRAFSAKRRTYSERARKRSFRASKLVAPVEIAALAPEAFLVGVGHDIGGCVFARPGEHLGYDRLGAVHRLLEAGLLLGLEERVIVERIRRLVMGQRHRRLEAGVAL